MKRLAILTAIVLGALALAAAGLADPGDGKGKGAKVTPKGGKLTFDDVRTADHGCDSRVWATDTLHRTYKVRSNHDGTYTVRREDRGTFVTTGPMSPSADPCPGVVRRGKHGTLLQPGVKGKTSGYIQGTVSGGTFNPKGSCTAECTNRDFVAGFFTPTTAGTAVTFTCNQGYAGCRFSFKYTAQRQNKQHLRYHHWEDRGTDGVTEVFIGDIATS